MTQISLTFDELYWLRELLDGGIDILTDDDEDFERQIQIKNKILAKLNGEKNPNRQHGGLIAKFTRERNIRQDFIKTIHKEKEATL
jgi:hypothetical protein